MHPYVIEKLAASRREDFLAGAERHRRRVQARSNQPAPGRLGAQAVARHRGAPLPRPHGDVRHSGVAGTAGPRYLLDWTSADQAHRCALQGIRII